MEMLLDVLPIIVYILLIIFLIVGIILGIKAIFTLDKIEKIIDNVTDKLESLNPIFDLFDYASDRLTSVTDKVFEFLTGIVGKLLTRKTKRKDDKDE